MALLNDPILWFRSAVGSKIRLIAMSVFYMAVAVALFKHFSREANSPQQLTGLGLVAVFSTLLPVYFFYAGHRLLQQYDKHVQPPQNWKKVPDLIIAVILIGLSVAMVLVEWQV